MFLWAAYCGFPSSRSHDFLLPPTISRQSTTGAIAFHGYHPFSSRKSKHVFLCFPLRSNSIHQSEFWTILPVRMSNYRNFFFNNQPKSKYCGPWQQRRSARRFHHNPDLLQRCRVLGKTQLWSCVWWSGGVAGMNWLLVSVQSCFLLVWGVRDCLPAV